MFNLKHFLNKAFVLIAFSVTVMALVVANWLWREVEKDRLEDLQKTALFLNNFYELTFNQRELGLVSIGERMLAIEGANQQSERLSVALNALSAHTDFVAMGLSDTTGQLITFTGVKDQNHLPNLASSEETRRTFQQATKADRIIIGEAYYFDLIGKWIIPLRVPIRNESGKLLAVNTSGIGIETMMKELDRFKIHPSYRVTVVNSLFNRIQMYYPLTVSAFDSVLRRDASVYKDYQVIDENESVTFFNAYSSLRKTSVIGVKTLPNVLNHYVVVTADTDILWLEYRTTFYVSLGTYFIIMTALFIGFRYLRKKEQRYEVQLAKERFYSESIITATTALVVGVDSTLNCTFVNPATEKLTGYSRNELVGPDWWRLLYPDWVKKHSTEDEGKQVRLILRTLLKADRENHEVILTTKKGEKKNILWSFLELHEQDKNEVIGFGIDITDLRKTEALSLAREANLLSIVESTNNIIGLFNPNYELIEFNQSFREYALQTDNITLYKGMPVLDMMNRPQAEIFRRLLDRALQGEKISEIHEYPSPVGTFYFMMNYNPIYQAGRITGASLFVQDITELRSAQESLKKYATNLEEMVAARSQEIVEANSELNKRNEELSKTLANLQKAQEQLIQSEKMASLGILSAGVAHEINNPLNFIKGGVNALTGIIQETGEEKVREAQPFIDIIHEGVNRATAIVKGLSHFSRQTELNTEEVNIHAVLDNCLLILNNKLKHKVKVDKKYTTNESTVVGNEGQLHQAFLNILSNSEQAIEGKGEIMVTTMVDGNSVSVLIRDNGIGIQPENLSKISDPFYTTKAPGEGTGLGLSITYKIIQEHNGTIAVTSTWKEGTEFIISLPLKK